MHDTVAVRRVNRTRHLDRQPQCAVERQRTVQLLAFDVLHDDVVRTDVIDLADVGMVQRGDSAGLSLEALGEFFARNFDGDDPVEPRVPRPVHLAHATCSDGRNDLVRTKKGPGCYRHRR